MPIGAWDIDPGGPVDTTIDPQPVDEVDRPAAFHAPAPGSAAFGATSVVQQGFKCPPAATAYPLFQVGASSWQAPTVLALATLPATPITEIPGS